MAESYKIAIIGAGPGGLSAGGRAAAEGVPHILLESAPHIANTIYRYQKGKHIMAEPPALPLRSPVRFEAGKRETIIENWQTDLKSLKINIRHNCEVTAISGKQGKFQLKLKNGSTITAENVVLGIGLQGNPRKLGVEGEDHAIVQYTLDDPDAFKGQNIAVIGAGDAAIENALALAKQNTVYIVNRQDEFARAKNANRQAILEAIEKGKIECFYNSTPARVEPFEGVENAATLVLNTAQGEAALVCNLIIARLGAIPPRKFVEDCGIVFPNKDMNAVPELSERYESNVKGIYIIGALGGYPLIKQCMNQGYEVVDYILGRNVAPADEPLLQAKCDRLPGKPRVAEVLARIRANVPIFAELTTLQLREFLVDSELHSPKEDSVIFERNDYTNSFYSIIGGYAHVQIDPENPDKTITLGQGRFFGEMSLISGRRRSATVRAGTDCILLETPRNSMNKLINSVESVKRVINQVFISRALHAHFAPDAQPELVDEIARTCTIHEYKAGDTVFTEGDKAESLHLVRRGSLTVSRRIGERDIVLSYVPAGNYVGEMGIMGGGTRSATVKAAIAAETIELSADAFELLLMNNPELRQRIEEQYKQRLTQNLLMQQQPGGGDVISFLMSQGLGEATDVLLIDESLCIRCNNCEIACAETHDGTSRLNREAGPTYAYIHVPTSCRHCEHPHCMKECPPDAIHRAPDGEVFIADNCIGCGNCERNCPYGVIQMASPPSEKPGLLQWLLFGWGPGPGQADEELLKPAVAAKKQGGEKLKQAVKCDMCKDIKGGAACVRACPTGAAIRINPDKLTEYLNA
jgi:CRP-like cAMP-binding protein/thioredoxin reductase/Na+-translocating ferredoxin:NAD+ oxidoreductase RNF subunit RnfB